VAIDKGRKQILFHAALPHHFVFFQPVYDILRRDPRLAIWCSANVLGWGLKVNLFDLFDVDKEYTISSVTAMTKEFDLFISPIYTKIEIGRGARQKLQIFHGIAITNCFLKPAILDFDKWFMIGPYMVKRFAQKGLLASDDPRIEMVGMPKTDPLVNGTLDRAAIQQELELNPDLPTVLYAPSGTHSSLSTDGLDVIQRVREMPVNLLVKLHDKSRDQRRHLKDWMGRVKKWHGGNTCVIEGFDIIPALFVSDILISDFSSAANEFLLLDRPIIFLDTPEKYEINKERWDTEVWGQRVGALVKTMMELDRALEDALARPQRMSEIRRAAAQDIFYKPGTATPRAVEGVYRILELDAIQPVAQPRETVMAAEG
jgi:hypothetical protein